MIQSVRHLIAEAEKAEYVPKFKFLGFMVPGCENEITNKYPLPLKYLADLQQDMVQSKSFQDTETLTL